MMREYLKLIEGRVPTKVFFGENCVVENRELLKNLGSRALVVTGKSSAKNGALSDVFTALNANGQEYAVYDRVLPNPTVACVREAIALLKSVDADFIVAIGGGSPMDAAKAIATLALQDRRDEDIFKGGYEDIALPMAHIPTTAGTGSEVTPYSILTNDIEKTKTSIYSNATYPKYAFLDARYTESLGVNSTVNTAIDALSHAIEGTFTLKSDEATDSLALKAIELIFSRINSLKTGSFTKEDREVLLVASTLAGVVIARTGTTVVHSMGYSLTYHHNVDHGRANGLLLGAMLALCEERVKDKTDRILRACSLKNAEEFSSLMDSLFREKEDISTNELYEYASECAKSKKLPNILYKPTYEDILKMYLTSFKRL